MGSKIVQTIKNSSGEIMEYVLETGERVDKAQGVLRAKNGEIDGVIIAHSKKGEEYLRTKPDGTEGNNLSSMSKED
ncbi:DUF3892 domain-containing protein [Clostridium celatum]|uniref:DUF3892 domain-containing protein n=1 Tax=Clostridium celatum DSM 1785 TaxID=545697 RepID=L1QA75_9CLOT|nr:DUF3892 domain-containing protein [Clostridium celatum]EKY24630.1 hypothetical protein HMPREF0216_02660 [Clostridium celatum DSM 1785]MCE9656312.1 DUF3892 domain-containing protein [Clostridium celatum]MDU6296548.1 DUF3892 domain-containing protein [Clostridium celatum]MDY3361650.1 DUF3892 domain-containing protein [Clostridium celatum]